MSASQKIPVPIPKLHSIRISNEIIITSHPEGFFSAKNENDRTEWSDKHPEVAFLTAVAMCNKPLENQITRTRSGNFLLLQIKPGLSRDRQWAIMEKSLIKWQIIIETQ